MKENSCLDQYYDARYYENDVDFTIGPNEDVILIIRNCGNHWFRHALSYELKYANNRFETTSDVPHQQCLWIKNISSTTSLFVEEKTTLSSVLALAEIVFKLCHVATDDLYAYHNANENDMEDAADDDDDNDDDDEDEGNDSGTEYGEESTTTTTTTTTTTITPATTIKEKELCNCVQID